MKPRRLLFPASLVFSLVAVPLSAQTIYDWKSDAPDGNWTQGAAGARWYDTATTNNLWDIPASGTGAVLRFNNDAQLTMTNNASGTYELHGMIFGASATSVRTIGGNSIRLYDFGTVNPYITNDSSATHVLDLDINGDGGESLKININGSGGLTFNGAINNQGSWIDVVGSTASAATVTFNGVVSDSGGIYKGNASTTLVLANSGNTYSGGTTISAGTVSFANGALGTTGSITVNDGTLQWATGNTQDISGRLTLQNATTANLDTNGNNVALATAFGGATSASLNKIGAGTLTLSGANTFTGATTVSGGTLRLGLANALSGTSAVTVASGATFDAAGFSPGKNFTISGQGVGGTGALYNSRSDTTTSAQVSLGTLTLAADAKIAAADNSFRNTFNTSGIVLGGNVLTLGPGRLLMDSTDAFSGGGSVAIESGGVLHLGGNSSGGGAATITVKTGGVINGRDYVNTGLATVPSIILAGGTLGNAAVDDGNGATNGGGAQGNFKNDITVNADGGTLTGNNSTWGNTLRLSGTLTGSGALTLNGGVGVEFMGDASGYSGTATATAGTVTFNNATTQGFGGVIAGSRPVQKIGSGTTTFSGANTYTGATTVSGGTLVLAGANTGNTAVTVGSGATLRLDYSTQNNSKLHDTPSLTLNGATVELAGGTHTEVVGGVSLGAGTNVTINRSSGSAILQMNTITRGANATLNFGASGIATTDSLNTNGILGTWATIAGGDWAANSTNGVDGLITAPNYTLTSVALDTAASYADAHMSVDSSQTPGGAITPHTLTFKSGGAHTLNLTATNTIKAGGILVAPAVGNNASAITGGNLQTGSAGGDLVIVQNNISNNLTIGSVIQNNTSASSLTKRGTGTLMLTGVNTYTGSTNVAAGTLQFGIPNAIATSGLVMTGGTVDLAGVNPSVLGLRSDVASAGTITNSAAGAGTNTLSITGGWFGNFSGVIQNGATAKTAMVLSGTNGRISWSGNNTFTGGLAINGNGSTDGVDSGVILGISADAALGAADNVVTLNNGGTLFNAASNSSGWSASTSPTLAAGRSIVMGSGAGGVFRVWGSSTFIVNSIISGTGALTKTDGGTLALGGNNTYSGVTTVKSGTIRLDHGQALGPYLTGRPVTQVVVASGGAVDLNAKGATYGYTIAGTGVGGTGALINTGAAIGNGSAQTSNIRLSGNATIGGSGNWSLLTNSYAATSLDLGGFTLTKAGANTISLVSTTTTEGSIQVNAGVLAFGVTNGGSGVVGDVSSLSLANTAGVSLALNRNSSIGSLSGGGATGGSVVLGSSTLTIGALNSNTTYSGVISGTGTLTKAGTGTLTLTGANTYTGATTTLSRGGISLDFSASGAPAANILNNTSNSTALSMGGGTLTLIGKASSTNSQRLNGLTLTGGNNSIALTANATANPLVLTLGTITRTGGSINFTLPAGVQSATNGITTTSPNDATGILGTWATVGGTDFATVSSGNIVAYSGYTDVKRLDASANSIVSGSNSNVRIVEGSGTAFNILLGSPTTTINTLTQSASAGSGAATIDPDAINSTLAVGSVLLAANAGSLTIGSTSGDGILMAASAGGTLILNNQSATNPLTANSVVANNTSASGLLKTGPGTVELNGSNTYTGVTTVSQGKLRVTNTSGMGGAGNAVSLAGGTLELATDTAVTSKNLTLSASSTIILDRATPGTGFSTSFGGITFGDSHTLTVAKGANVTSGNATLNFTGFPALGAAGKTAGFDIGSGAEVELSGNLSGTQQFARINKAGSGTLILSGNNDWWDPANSSGLVTVTGGTLDLRSANAMGDGTTGSNSIALSMAASTTLRLGTNSVLNNHADLSLTGSGVTITSDRASAGAGITNQFDVLGIGAHTLNVTGGANVTSGTTQVNFKTAVLAGNAVFNVTNPAAAGSGTTLQIGAVSGTGFGITKNGGGLLVLNGANTYTGATTVSGGTLQLGSGGTGGSLSTSSSISVATGATFSVNQTDTVTQGTDFSGSAISGAGGFAQLGSGTTVLSAANTYTGRTTITAGTLYVSADNNLGTAPGTATAGHLVINGGTLSVGTTFFLAANRGIAVGPATGTGSGTISVSADQTLTYGGIVANNGGTGQLIKSGAGTLVLNGNNTYSGGTTVSAGTLQVGHNKATNGRGTLNGGNLTITNGVTYSIDGGLTFASNVNATVSAASGTASIQGFDVNSADIIVNNGVNATIASSVNLVSGGTYGHRLELTGNLTFAGSITGTPYGMGQWGNSATTVGTDKMVLFKRGAGALTLTGASTVTGSGGNAAFSIEQGDLVLSGGDNRLPAVAAVYLGGTSNQNARLVLDGVNQTLSGLQSTGTGTLAVVGGNATASTLTISNSNNYTFAGKIGGTGTNENNLALSKLGIGILTLSGANTYAGNTAVDAGRLNVNGSITSATSVAAAAILGGDGTITGDVALSGTLLPGQGGSTDRSLTINGNVTTNAGSTLSFTVTSMANHDQLVIGAGSSIGLGNADLDVTFDPLLTFDILGAGEGDDFLAALDSFAGTGSWFKLISGTTSGMFNNVKDTLNASELAYFGLSGTQYKTNIDGQDFWVAQGSAYLVAIPEPRAALLGGIGVLLLLRRRR